VADPAYVAALRLLARRELSEAQIRARLARGGHDGPSIDAAIVRLTADRSLDDNRVALAIARTETGIRRRGRRREQQKMVAAGISEAVASRALDEVFEQVDEEALLRAALDRRFPHQDVELDDRARARLYRQLTGQGFEHGKVLTLLQQLPRKPRSPIPDP
jgi:regulatory protein